MKKRGPSARLFYSWTICWLLWPAYKRGWFRNAYGRYSSLYANELMLQEIPTGNPGLPTYTE